MDKNNPKFITGLKHGIPTALGYFVVSFTFGMMASGGGLSPFYATLISMTSLTSAGQFAGLNIMVNSGTYIELIISMLVINSRYMLMSTALSQKLQKPMAIWKKMIISTSITDENFGVAMIEVDTVTFQYFLGVMSLPYLGWSLGTLLGSLLDGLLDKCMQNAASIALYCMFIALFIPPAKDESSIRQIIILTILISILLYYIPLFSFISAGYKILIAAIIGALYGAVRYPREVV